MFLIDSLFYIFSTVLLLSSLVVVGSQNTIYSVMFLILAFFNAAGLFVLLNAEFLAMLLVIVYVGAIAVLFLFVIMMLNIDQKPDFKKNFNRYLPILISISTVLFIELFFLTQNSLISTNIKIQPEHQINNVKAIGDVLYTKFFYPFQLSGMILLVAMIGAIVLTLKEENIFKKKQNIFEQNLRKKSSSIDLIQAEVGKGIDV